MLDDANYIKQHDPEDALGVAGLEYSQEEFEAMVWNEDHDDREVKNVVVAGMGGSGLAAVLVKAWLKDEIGVPFDVLRSYDLPAYVGKNTLFIASSYSGNTEETLSALSQAEVRGAQLGIIAAGGKLIDEAGSYKIAHVSVPANLQPRKAVSYDLRALLALLINFGVIDREKFDEVAAATGRIKMESAKWASSVPTDQNYAKQLAMQAVGKTPVIYGGALTAPVAYKWKISWNENAKNVAFWNEYPEFNHNEFLGWTSHPVEKPFVIFDLISPFEHSQILKRFEISDRLLSGMRPKAITVTLKGETLIEQLLWGCILADFVSIYVAILNNVDPTPVMIIEKLKKELV